MPLPSPCFNVLHTSSPLSFGEGMGVRSRKGNEVFVKKVYSSLEGPGIMPTDFEDYFFLLPTTRKKK
jgi:hypothetical protein